MSAGTIDRQSAAFIAASQDLNLPVTPDGPLRWSLTVPGWPSRVSARLDGEWLLLEGPFPPGRERRALWDLLRWNGVLAGPGKFALVTGGRVALRAEVPLEDAHVLPHWLRSWCRDLVAAEGLLGGREGVAPSVPSGAAAAGYDGSSALETLGPMCEAAGWSFTEHSASRLSVALDLPEGYHQASLELLGDGTVRASVELARFDCLTRLARRAVAILLLRASGMVRLVRGAVLADGAEEATARFEVRLGLPLGAGELHHALSALATAARLCGREVDALRDESLARAYLSVHEPGSGEAGLIEAVTPHNTQEALHATE